MEDNKLTQEMKRHAAIAAVHAKRSDFEISQFLNDARSLFTKFVESQKHLMAM